MEAAGVCCGVQYLQGVRVLHFDQPQGWHLALDPLQATEYARDDWVSASPGEREAAQLPAPLACAQHTPRASSGGMAG